MKRSLWSSFLVVGLLSASPLFAQAGDDAARDAFQAGERAFARDDYVVALEEFRRAFREAPRDAVRFNIGVCLERLGRFKEAVSEYTIAAKSSELDEEKRERAKSDAERVRRRLGTLRADADVSGAVLYVDGEKACDLPCSVELDPRKHEVVAKKAGREASQSVTLASGETESVRLAVGAPAPAPPPRKQPSKPLPPKEDKATGPGILTWVGGGMAIVGTAGFVGFGLRARALEDDYDASPTQETRDDGLRMQTFTNVSLGVALTGVALVAVDLIFFSGGRDVSTARSGRSDSCVRRALPVERCRQNARAVARGSGARTDR